MIRKHMTYENTYRDDNKKTGGQEALRLHFLDPSDLNPNQGSSLRAKKSPCVG